MPLNQLFPHRYRKVPRNLLGRDFVIADIHGSFDLVLRSLDAVNFDPSKDRLFVCGDYIDRGAESYRVLRFLKNPWVYAILGNHESMVLDLYSNGEPHPAMLEYCAQRNGFEWWLTTTDEMRQDIVDILRTLPYVLETDTSRGRVGFIHAEVPEGLTWSQMVAAVQAGDPRVTETILWGRSRIKHGDGAGVRGIDRIFVGHTPVNHPVRLANVFYMDTGAVYGILDPLDSGRMTIGNLLCSTQVLVAPSKRPFAGVDVRDIPSVTPFSAYTTTA